MKLEFRKVRCPFGVYPKKSNKIRNFDISTLLSVSFSYALSFAGLSVNRFQLLPTIKNFYCIIVNNNKPLLEQGDPLVRD